MSQVKYVIVKKIHGESLDDVNYEYSFNIGDLLKVNGSKLDSIINENVVLMGIHDRSNEPFPQSEHIYYCVWNNGKSSASFSRNQLTFIANGLSNITEEE